MSLRERLTISIIAILVLFSVNVGTDSWSNNTRNTSLTKLQQAVNGQLQSSAVKQDLDDLHKAILLLSSLRSTLNENLTMQEIGQALSEISTLQADIQELGLSSDEQTKPAYTSFYNSFMELLPLWKTFYRNYNDASYDHYSERDYREVVF